MSAEMDKSTSASAPPPLVIQQQEQQELVSAAGGDQRAVGAVNVGVEGFTPKSVHQLPRVSPTQFSLDADEDDCGAAGFGREGEAVPRAHVTASQCRQQPADGEVRSKKHASSGRSAWSGLRHSKHRPEPHAQLRSGDEDDRRVPARAMSPTRKAASAPDLQALEDEERVVGRRVEKQGLAAAVQRRSVFRPMASHYALEAATIGTGGYGLRKRASAINIFTAARCCHDAVVPSRPPPMPSPQHAAAMVL